MIGERPNDTRGFLHKKLIRIGRGIVGGIVGGIPIVGPIARDIGRGIGIFPGGGGRGGGGFRPRPQPIVEPPPTTTFPLLPIGTPGTPDTCRPRESSRCCTLRTGSVADQAQWQAECGTSGEAQPQFGGATMGQFGAGLEPAVFNTTTRVCPRGAVLGLDGLCYNRRDIRNSERMWPRGTRPLLTGGEVRCIRIASSASKKLQRKTKQLQAMGMLPKPSRRAARALPSGHHAHVAHD